MGNTTRDFLNEFFTERKLEVKDSIVLAVTARLFKVLVEELDLRKTPKSMHIVDDADNVYVTDNENVIIVKTLFVGVHDNFISLPAHVTQLINQLFTKPDEFYFIHKRHDGTTISKGKLHDPALLTAHTAAIQLARVNEITSNGLKRKLVDDYEVYLHSYTDHDRDIDVTVSDADDVDLPHLEISLEDGHDNDHVVAYLNIEEVKRLQEAVNKFLVKHVK